MFEALIKSPWAPGLIWAALYVSDYCWTIAGAQLYQAQRKICYEGSYEITPIFQADVNALRRVSPRFLFILVASTAYLWWMRSMISPSDGAFGFYVMCLGSLFLLEVSVHVRHLRNWYQFSRVVPLLEGRLEYRRGVLLRSSAFDLLLSAMLYLIVFGVTRHPFVLGGAVACAVLSLNHYRLATRHEAAARQRLAAG